jgi:hypothetical protein
MSGAIYAGPDQPGKKHDEWSEGPHPVRNSYYGLLLVFLLGGAIQAFSGQPVVIYGFLTWIVIALERVLAEMQRSRLAKGDKN